MIIKFFCVTLLLALCVSISHSVSAQEKGQQSGQTSPQNMKGMDMDAMNKRGDHVMGFDHTKTTHHFQLTKDGGVIRVEANEANDANSRDEIRMHLSHIAVMFSEGNFKAPMLIHAQTPPGVTLMKNEKAKIKYVFEETERGGRVIIKTSDPQVLKAIYEFLRFQITEHKTGDSVEVT